MELDAAWYGMLYFIPIFIFLWLTLPISVSFFANTSNSSHNMTFTFSLWRTQSREVDIIDHSPQVLTADFICWCYTGLFKYLICHSVTVVLFTSGDFYEVDCFDLILNNSDDGVLTQENIMFRLINN